MKNNLSKQILPFIIIIAVFLLISVVYMLPQFEGKTIKQHDIIQYTGMSKEIADFRQNTGEEAYWTNSAFSGMPAYQISTLYKGNISKTFDYIFRFFMQRPASTVFLYMIGFFILLLSLKVNKWYAMIGAIAYGLTTYLFIILTAGHNSKAIAIAYMAPTLAGVLLAYRGKYLLGTFLTALFLSLQIWANHFQITYYLAMIILIVVVVEFIYQLKEKTLKNFFLASSFLLIAALISLGTNFANLYTTWSYSHETTRGKSELVVDGKQNTGLDKEYATTWSYGKMETFTLLIPNFNGGVSNGELSENSNTYKALVQNNVPAQQAKQIIKNIPLYWGPQPGVGGPIYIGAIIIFLFVLGCFVLKGRLKYILLIATILSIILAWGNNFNILTDFFLKYVPMYNKFRAVSMTLVIAELTIPLMAILALWQITKKSDSENENKKKINKYILYSAGIVGGICLIFALFSSVLFNFSSINDVQYKDFFPEWMMSAIMEDRAHLLKADAWRSFVYVLLAASLIWLFTNKKIKQNVLIPAMCLLIIFDLWFIDKRYLNDSHFVRKSQMEKPFKLTNADKTILEDKDLYYRVFNQTVSPFNDASTSYFHKSIGGYHAAKLQRYQDVIENHLSKGNMNVYNMLNAKWFITPGQNQQEPVAQLNNQALGNAWFISKVEKVNNANEENEALNRINPATTLVYDKRFESIVGNKEILFDSTAKITLTSYAPNKLVYKSNSLNDGVAVFSDIYYDKGWNAYINDKKVDYFRANYILRGLNIPKGENTIEFKFEPQEIKIGETISKIGSVLIVLTGLLLVFDLYRKRNKKAIKA